MKRVNFVFSLFVMILLTACNKDAGYYNEYSDDDIVSTGNESGNNDYADEEGLLTSYRINGNDIEKIRDFSVSKKLKSYQLDYARHLNMWNYFRELIPFEYRGRIIEFVVFHGEGEWLGYVEPIQENDLSKWRMGLAIDVDVDLQVVKLKDDFAFTSIHEYGHVLTLNESQVEAGEGNCSTYYTGEGCAFKDAYINQVFELAWMDIQSEHDQIHPDDYDALDAFYEKYSDRFVSDYAASNPGEDIAEAFTYFIIESAPRSGNSIADQKVNLFYAFQEAVELRTEIRKNPAVSALKLSTRSYSNYRLSRKTCLKHRHNHKQN